MPKTLASSVLSKHVNFLEASIWILHQQQLTVAYALLCKNNTKSKHMQVQ